jgi:hypothetical protein
MKQHRVRILEHLFDLVLRHPCIVFGVLNIGHPEDGRLRLKHVALHDYFLIKNWIQLLYSCIHSSIRITNV